MRLMFVMHLFCYEAKQPNLKLKTWPKQLLGSLPIAFVLPAVMVDAIRQNGPPTLSKEMKNDNANFQNTGNKICPTLFSDYLNIKKCLVQTLSPLGNVPRQAHSIPTPKVHLQV